MVESRDCRASCRVWGVSVGSSGGGVAGGLLVVVFVALSDCSEGGVGRGSGCWMTVKRGVVLVDCMVLESNKHPSRQ